MTLIPKKDAIALDLDGVPGVIVSGLWTVERPDGLTEEAWCGLRLSDPVGAPWSAARPVVVLYSPGLADALYRLMDLEEEER